MWGECCVGFGDDYGSLELMDPHRILLFHNSSKKKKEKKKKKITFPPMKETHWKV